MTTNMYRFIDGKLLPFLSLVHDLLLNTAYHQTFGMRYMTSSLVEHLNWQVVSGPSVV
jgi:hypothetical protein